MMMRSSVSRQTGQGKYGQNYSTSPRDFMAVPIYLRSRPNLGSPGSGGEIGSQKDISCVEYQYLYLLMDRGSCVIAGFGF